MKNFDTIHALILFDQKKLTSRKTILENSSGAQYKFMRADTQLNWSHLIAEENLGNEVTINSKKMRVLNFEAEEPSPRTEVD